jgi:hypothetical protein
MSNILRDRCWLSCSKLVLLAAIVALPMSAQGWAQTPATAMAARFAPGENLRYEFEGIVQMVAGHARDVKVDVPEGCSYRLRAVLSFDFDHASAEGALSGRVHFRAIRYEGGECALPRQSALAKSLQSLEANGAKFEINPAGDTRLSSAPANAECEGVSVLLKAAWDLLQLRLSDKAIAPGTAPLSTQRFLFWPDTFVEDMEVTSSSMQYQQDVTVAARPYAWLKYKQVFSPEEMPAYVEPRSRARDFTGTTFVTGKANVSLLFDRSAGQIVYLRRERNVDNRMMLKYAPSETSVAVATYAIDEEYALRWLPEKDSEAWLAELHKFENDLVEVAAVRRNQPHVETHETASLSELLDRAPRGFERWERNYCRGAYCFELSIAVPEQAKVAETTDTTVLLLSGSGERAITVAVGPVLDPRRAALNDEELLQQQTSRFIANDLWFAGGTGTQLNFESERVHDRPAAFSDFTSMARDLTPIRGRLVMVIGPYDRLTTVTCSYAAAERSALDGICQTVAASVVIR